MVPDRTLVCLGSFFGKNFAFRAAFSAATRNCRSPFSACAAITTPPAPFTRIKTVTLPDATALLAFAGYSGLGTLASAPAISPASTGTFSTILIEGGSGAAAGSTDGAVVVSGFEK